MNSPDRPFVAVVGGLWQLDPAQSAAAKAAAQRIGAELAKAGFGLVVYFANDESLEPHVVAGYVAAMPVGSGSNAIRVRYAESQRGQVKFVEEATRSELFETRLFPGPDWEAPFYRSLAESESVDAVLLLGGANSTLIAGQIAVARRLPTLAVDEFGGSASKIWQQLAQTSTDAHPSWRTTPPEAHVARLKGQVAALAAEREERRRQDKAFVALTAKGRQTAYAAGAFALLLATVFFGIVSPPAASAYPLVMFGGLICAGAMGALLRSILWGPGEHDARTSFLLGSIAGFVVGLAYLIPQWVGAPGPLSPKTTDVSANDKIQFASVVLVALSAGIGFDTVFSRLQKQAQDVPIGPARRP
jgi:hypothetical protein